MQRRAHLRLLCRASGAATAALLAQSRGSSPKGGGARVRSFARHLQLELVNVHRLRSRCCAADADAAAAAAAAAAVAAAARGGLSSRRLLRLSRDAEQLDAVDEGLRFRGHGDVERFGP